MVTDPVVEKFNSLMAAKTAEIEELESAKQEALHEYSELRVGLEQYLRVQRQLVAADESKGVVSVRKNPRGEDMIYDILVEAGRLHEKDILARMLAADWYTTSDRPITVIRTYLGRLQGRKRIRRVAKGTYEAVRNGVGPAEAGPTGHLRLHVGGGDEDAENQADREARKAGNPVHHRASVGGS